VDNIEQINQISYNADYGKPRVLPKNELERYCELIAALKINEGLYRQACA
jgi:hypothetical protein